MQTWKDRLAMAVSGIAIITFLLRADIKAVVESGWTWLYLALACYAVFYIHDAYKRAAKWLTDWRGDLTRILEDHKKWCEEERKDWSKARDKWEGERAEREREFGRQVASQIEDAVRWKVNTAMLEAEAKARF